MKRIIIIIALLVLYAGSLKWKDGVIQKNRAVETPTIPAIRSVEGTPVYAQKASEKNFYKTLLASGFMTKNGQLKTQVSPDLKDKLAIGLEVFIENEGNKIKGTITSLSSKTNVYSGLYELEATFRNFPVEWIGKLKVMRIPYDKISGKIVLPKSAISLRDGKSKVYKIIENKVHITEVQLLDSNTDNYVINAGVADGEEVITSDQRYLLENEKVKVINN
ncbi:HlyD family secretion domain protein [Bacteriovorax sp. BSW11_IV]|uniref:secretion protein HlyD n=1 Tax=Bacteriovorax sp. BSW11_IV TaxID=1353529 RepID=UPI00038A3CCC|nr:secretion protein HlyD [Bacteriovorax sp. BSW11_IV]EQC48860.1 HlyD family secretion domain protein [Bacteriovorax sp. BSW11_IV]